MRSTSGEADAVWPEPDGVVPRGTLIVVPGRGETAEVYSRLGRRLSADGYRVLVVGDPLRDPARTAARIGGLVSDGASGPHPRVLVGSDTGALFAASLLARGLAGIDALVTAGLPTSAAGAPLDWATELEARTACPVHRARLEGTDLRGHGLTVPMPAEWAEQAQPERIRVPVLGLHGDADTVAPIARARDWYTRLDRVELLALTGGRHDALNDQSHRSVAASVVLFLERLRTGLPAIVTVDHARGVERFATPEPAPA